MASYVLPYAVSSVETIAYHLFQRQSKDMLSSRKTLYNILQKNKNTAIYKDKRMSEMPTINDFREGMPITGYEDYREYVERVVQGEKDVLGQGDPVFIAITTGTSSQPKKFPKYYDGSSQPMVNLEFREHGIKYADTYPALIIMTTKVKNFTASGLPICPVTVALARRFRGLAPVLASPVDLISEITSYMDSLLLHALFALCKRDLGSIMIPFAKICIDFLHVIQTKFTLLVEAIRTGNLPHDQHFTNPISDTVRMGLHEKLVANPERARELEDILKGNSGSFEGVLAKIWPRIKCVCTIHSAHFKIHIPTIRRFIGDVPLLGMPYASSESLFGIPYKGGYVLMPGVAYFEFIPKEWSHLASKDIPRHVIMEMHELQEGMSYEILVTNGSGLYRYRMGDLLKVVGWYNKLPIIEVVGRLNMTLTVADEKMTEEQIQIATRMVAERAGLAQGTMGEYCAVVDISTPPGSYCFYAKEPADDVQGKQLLTREGEATMAKYLDEELGKVNVLMSMYRGNGRIGATKFKWVKPDTFTELTAMKAQNSVISQAKLPVVTSDPTIVEVLRRNVTVRDAFQAP